MLRLLLRDVAVAGDDYVESGCVRLQIELREIVQHVDGNATYLDDFGHRQLAGPCGLIDIATDGGYRRDGCEFVKNLWRTNVSRVNDMLRTAQRGESFRAKQAVGIGDDADDDGVLRSQFSVLSS